MKKQLCLCSSLLLTLMVLPPVYSQANTPPAMEVTLVTPAQDVLLRHHEKSGRHFKRLEVKELKRVSFFHRRKIGEALVEKDFIRYQYNTETGELVSQTKKWRDGLPKDFIPAVSRQEAENLVDGTVLQEFTKLYFISPETDVFKVSPPPSNPCWIIRSKEGERFIITIIDSMTGKELGKGLPPPYAGLSIHGPDDGACPQDPIWYDHAKNAHDWFETMGYDTIQVGNASEATVQSHIQSDSTSMFYELDHGGSTSFHNRCDQDISALEVEAWITGYSSMPFAFIGSCGGLCSTVDNTFSHEFRKGSSTDTAVVGYCGMADAVCSDCWPDAIPWQTELFSRMNNGYSVYWAYYYANLAYPDCSDDSHSCMRISGDTNLKFKGSGVSHVTRSKCGSLYNYPPYYFSPLPGVQNRLYSRAYHFRCNNNVPSGTWLTASTSSTYPYIDIVFLNDSTFTAYGAFMASGEDGEITFVSAENRNNGMKFTGEMNMVSGGQIKIYE